MELSETLKSTLEKTRNLAVALEYIGNQIHPSKSPNRAAKRLIFINREIKVLSQGSNNPKFSSPKQSLTISPEASERPSSSINDSPGYIVKKRLSNSIKEMNEQVKMSKAGKKTIGIFMSKNAGSPKIVSKLKNLSDSFRETHNFRFFNFEEIDELPQPYVPLTNAKIEDPIVLPTFTEFLQANGAEYVIRKGSEDLFFRIQRAIEKVGKLKEMLESKAVNLPSSEEKKRKKRTKRPVFGTKMRVLGNDNKKVQDMRKTLNQYYEMPIIYTRHPEKLPNIQSPRSVSMNISSEAEESLEESLRNFYRSKALENKKLSDILDRLKKDRPYSIREKLSLIQEDHEKYKNKNHSIGKFNEFREKVEQRKRAKQLLNFTQGLLYLEILDEFKVKKHEPSDPELIILEVWRRVVESGWLIRGEELEEIFNILTPEELSSKSVKYLLEKLKTVIYS